MVESSARSCDCAFFYASLVFEIPNQIDVMDFRRGLRTEIARVGVRVDHER
jgi:hypothetical protein